MNVPEALADSPYVDALDAARIAKFQVDEWERYERALMGVSNARGAVAYAYKQGVLRACSPGTWP
jgi:hypothetical protein